jgi:hypothetical protein
VGWDSPLGTSASNWSIVPAPHDRWWVWNRWWNENWQRKPKYSEKTCPVPICSPQIPHGLTWARTRAAAVGNRRLTAWAMAQLRRFTNWVIPARKISVKYNIRTKRNGSVDYILVVTEVNWSRWHRKGNQYRLSPDSEIRKLNFFLYFSSLCLIFQGLFKGSS